MKQTVLILVFVFLNCQTINQTVSEDSLKKKDSQKKITVLLAGKINYEMIGFCIAEANKERSNKLEYLESQGADYIFYFYRSGSGYLIKLWKGSELIQTARALSTYELPMAVAALSIDHIPDESVENEKNF